jgi:hypothetical protein
MGKRKTVAVPQMIYIYYVQLPSSAIILFTPFPLYINIFGVHTISKYFSTLHAKSKSKAVPLHAMRRMGGEKVQLLLILDLGTRWG